MKHVKNMLLNKPSYESSNNEKLKLSKKNKTGKRCLERKKKSI